MRDDRIYILDDITLFHPDVPENTCYPWKDLEKIRAGFRQTIIFLTYDIRSVLLPAEKFWRLYRTFFPRNILAEDLFGNSVRISGWRQLGLWRRRRADRMQEEALVSAVWADVKKRKAMDKVVKRYDGTGRPLYIKTAMAFGVQSGGMVAHSSGVLEAMNRQFGLPLVFTTDCLDKTVSDLPVVRMHLERFHDISELRELYFNISGFGAIETYAGRMQNFFVYQRASANNYIGVRLADRHRAPLVLEFNSSSVWTSRNWGKGGMKYEKLTAEIERLNLERADLIVCVSEELKATMVSEGIPADKILVNYNGVNIKRFCPEISGDDIRAVYGLEGKTVIGFAGSFDDFHGAEILASAFGNLAARRPDLGDKIFILFMGEGKSLDQVKRILKRGNVAGRFACTGAVPFEDMPGYLAACDILAAPHVPNKDKSPFFGSPTKLFEYMAMGKGIVASDLNQIGRVLSHEETALLVPPKNPRALSQALERLVCDEELRGRLGANARREAELHYTWDRNVERIGEKLKDMYGLGG